MDRRKHQIEIKLDEIVEESDLLKLNLEKIIHQVRSCSELVNSSKKCRQKDYSLILKYELEVLKKIIEINFELESLIDESPGDQIQSICGLEDCSSLTIKPEEIKSEEKVSVPVSHTSLESIVDSEFGNIPCPPTQLPELNLESVAITTGNFSDDDIQTLRNTLKKFSEKLGLSPESFTTMTDIYQKHSVRRQVEIPEKDVGGDFFRQSSLPVVESSGSSNVTEMPKSSLPSTSSNNSEHEAASVSVAPRKNYVIDDFSSTDLSYVNATETSSTDEYATGENPENVIPVLDEHSVIIGNIKHDPQLETDDNPNQRTEGVYSALEKLNNTKFLNKKAETVAKMISYDKPDISLKPTENRIKNYFEANEKQSKKKKAKKNKNEDNVFYELTPRATPLTGTECVFSHVESPREFYIHVYDEEIEKIDELTEQINNLCKGTVTQYNSKEEASKAIGRFCFAFVISYNSWYRAEILDWDLESKSEDVVVHFVDYGDKKRISYKNLRRMTKQIAEIPMSAVRCHLALMYPPHSTYNERLTEWPETTIEALIGLSGLLTPGEGERSKIFRIVYASQEGNSVSIDMYNVQDEEEHTVGQILLDLGVAVQIIEEYDEDNSELERFLQDVDTLEKADNINEAVMDYDPRDEIRLCRFTKPDGTCYKGRHCKLEHAPLSKDGFTTDQIPIFREAMYSLPLPAKGELVPILVTGYRDICTFYIQLVRKPHNGKTKSQEKSVEGLDVSRFSSEYVMDKDLYLLLLDMNAEKTVRKYETFKVPPALGEIVTAKHPTQNIWIRGVVREKKTQNEDQRVEYQVFAVDLGDEMVLPIEGLRKIMPHFLELPFQLVESYLHNYHPKVGHNKKRADLFFRKEIFGRNFIATTMSSSLPLNVVLKTFDGRDIGKMLVDEGFAIYKNEDKYPDCHILELY